MAEELANKLCLVVTSMIFDQEGAWGMSVRRDFEEQFESEPTPNDRIQLCQRWLGMYAPSYRTIRKRHR